MSIKMRFKSLLTFLLIQYLIQNTKASDFCQSFVDNGFRINYSLDGGQAFPQKVFLLIHKNYWEFNVNMNDKSIDWVKNRRIHNTGIEKDYTEGSVKPIDKDNRIECKSISHSNITGTEVKQILSKHSIPAPETDPIVFENKSSVASTVNEKGNGGLVEFLGSPNDYNVRYFQIGNDFYVLTKSRDYLTDMANNLSKDYDLIRIFGPYLIPNESLVRDGRDGQSTTPQNESFDYLILIKSKENIIKYFFLYDFPLDIKTLINCSEYERIRIIPYSFVYKTYAEWFLIVSLVLFISVILLGLMAYYKWAYNTSDDQFTGSTPNYENTIIRRVSDRPFRWTARNITETSV